MKKIYVLLCLLFFIYPLVKGEIKADCIETKIDGDNDKLKVGFSVSNTNLFLLKKNAPNTNRAYAFVFNFHFAKAKHIFEPNFGFGNLKFVKYYNNYGTDYKDVHVTTSSILGLKYNRLLLTKNNFAVFGVAVLNFHYFDSEKQSYRKNSIDQWEDIKYHGVSKGSGIIPVAELGLRFQYNFKNQFAHIGLSKFPVVFIYPINVNLFTFGVGTIFKHKVD